MRYFVRWRSPESTQDAHVPRSWSGVHLPAHGGENGVARAAVAAVLVVPKPCMVGIPREGSQMRRSYIVVTLLAVRLCHLQLSKCRAPAGAQCLSD